MSETIINRRNILTVLGVAAAVTPALASEQIENVPGIAYGPGIASPSLETQERFAKALENAAASVRSGELTCVQMDIQSSVKFEEWMEHKVSFVFELGMPQKPVV